MDTSLMDTTGRRDRTEVRGRRGFTFHLLVRKHGVVEEGLDPFDEVFRNIFTFKVDQRL